MAGGGLVASVQSPNGIDSDGRSTGSYRSSSPAWTASTATVSVDSSPEPAKRPEAADFLGVGLDQAAHLVLGVGHQRLLAAHHLGGHLGEARGDLPRPGDDIVG